MKFLKNKNVRFHFGYPVSSEDCDTSNHSKKGVAFLIAVMMTAMMMIFMSDLLLNSALGVRMAAAQRDNLKAEYMAKSGVNLAIMLITGDFYKDIHVYEALGQNSNGMALGGMLSWSDSPDDIWSQLNGLPISGESIEMVSQFQENFELSKVGDSKILDGLQLFDGSFDINIVDQSSKINLNYCGVSQGQKCKAVLKSFMQCPAEAAYLEKHKVEVDEVVANIADWIDENNRVTAGASGGSEEDPYSDRNPEQGPKNAQLDSLAELKQIEGWTDDMHTIFSPYLRVFPQSPAENNNEVSPASRINFNTVDSSLLVCYLQLQMKNCMEKSQLAYNLRSDPDSGMTYPSKFDEIKQRLASNYCTSDEEVAKMFSYRSDIYQIVANGNVGDQYRKIEVDIERLVPDDDKIKQEIFDSYKIWNWKLN